MDVSIRSPMNVVQVSTQGSSVVIGSLAVDNTDIVQSETITNTIIKEVAGGKEVYTGATEFTPSDQAITVKTSGYALNTDITINPIPSNYGKITWDGFKMLIT